MPTPEQMFGAILEYLKPMHDFIMEIKKERDNAKIENQIAKPPPIKGE